MYCLSKVSSSARYVTAGNTVCRLNDILSHNYISLKKIIKSNTISLQYKNWEKLSKSPPGENPFV